MPRSAASSSETEVGSGGASNPFGSSEVIVLSEDDDGDVDDVVIKKDDSATASSEPAFVTSMRASLTADTADESHETKGRSTERKSGRIVLADSMEAYNALLQHPVPLVIDCRSAERHREGYLPGAYSVPCTPPLLSASDLSMKQLMDAAIPDAKATLSMQLRKRSGTALVYADDEPAHEAQGRLVSSNNGATDDQENAYAILFANVIHQICLYKPSLLAPTVL